MGLSVNGIGGVNSSSLKDVLLFGFRFQEWMESFYKVYKRLAVLEDISSVCEIPFTEKISKQDLEKKYMEYSVLKFWRLISVKKRPSVGRISEDDSFI